jgi:hypothetical protein
MSLGRAAQGALMVLGVVALILFVAGGLILGRMIDRGFRARDEPSAIEWLLARRMRAWAAPAASVT